MRAPAALAVLAVVLAATAGSSLALPSPGVPLVDPDVPTASPPIAIVTVLDAEVWAWTAGFRGRDIDVPPGWNRVVLVFTEIPQGDPWDRLFAASIEGVEVLRGTTPRYDMTVRKDVTRYASLLPPGGTARVEAYTDTYVGAMQVTLTLEFYNDVTAMAVESAAASVAGITRFSGLCTGSSITRTVTFPATAPDAATLELFLSGHGAAEFWFLNPGVRAVRVLVDGQEVGRAVLMPYVYAFLGLSGPDGLQNPTTLLAHRAMWWTAQMALDMAGVHGGTGEVAPYRVTVAPADLALLSGTRAVTVAIDTTGARAGECLWVTSASFVLDP